MTQVQEIELNRIVRYVLQDKMQYLITGEMVDFIKTCIAQSQNEWYEQGFKDGKQAIKK